MKLLCKTCNQEKEPQYFYSQKYTYKGKSELRYATKRCKECTKGKSMKIRRFKKELELSKGNLSLETKEFIKSIIKKRFYIDTIEAYKLAHHHINTFGFSERLYADIEEELSVMLNELLFLYKREEII